MASQNRQDDMIIRCMIGLLFALCVLQAKAQFFWGFPQQERVKQRQVQYVAPSFKGGDDGIKAFLLKNFKNPSEREQVDGRIVVALIVNTKGNVEQFYVVRSVSTTLDKEAVRVCRKMKFRPATKGKAKVKGRIDITLPIRNGRLSYLDLPTVEV